MVAIRKGRVTSDGVLLGGIVATAWGITGLAVLTGQSVLLDHDAIFRGGRLPGPLTLVPFLVAWQVMTAAMMLPSSLPMIHLFAQVSRGQPRPRLVLGIFLVAYFAIWTEFALAALILDGGIHALVNQWTWLAQRPQLIGGTLLALAGVFQFTPLKQRCLQECRTPKGFLWRYYRRGVWPALRLGLQHGLFCLGCCWALMLVMFGVGVGNLFWLIALTGVMVVEKTTRYGQRLVPYVGIGLLVLAAAVAMGAGSYVSIVLRSE